MDIFWDLPSVHRFQPIATNHCTILLYVATHLLIVQNARIVNNSVGTWQGQLSKHVRHTVISSITEMTW